MVVTRTCRLRLEPVDLGSEPHERLLGQVLRRVAAASQQEAEPHEAAALLLECFLERLAHQPGAVATRCRISRIADTRGGQKVVLSLD